MIHTYRCTKHSVVSGSVKDLESKSKIWANCIHPTEKELNALSKHAEIPLPVLKRALDRSRRPKVRELENYSMIVIRAPWEEHKFLLTIPLTIFISKHKNNIITIALKDLHAIEKVEELIIHKKIDLCKESTSYLTYLLLEEVFETYFSHMGIIEDEMDKIENLVVKHPSKITAQRILSMKKTLIYFNKALTANREVIAAVEKEYLSHIEKKHSRHFSSLNAEVSQLLDMVTTNKDVMTGTLDIHITSISNNLNQIMKTLTIIASFVLVPTLISGIYGMNFRNSPFNMPELNWQYGYFYALGLMGLSVIITFIYFKRKKWL